ncbi:MAG: hypothetical protein AB7W47_15950 [Calditrichaceae bacterium]
MLSRLFMVIFLAVAMFAFSGCGKTQEEKMAEQAAKQMEEAAKKMAENADDMSKAMEKMGEAFSGGESVEPVSFKDLKALLPESLPGMERTSATGEKTSAMGIKVSEANGEYQSDDGSLIEIKIMDMGSMSGFAAMATYAWTMTEFERESDTGYERTTKISGYKAFEEYNSDDKYGKIQILVGDRFIVEIEGNGVEMEALKEAAKKINLGKLFDMRTEGIS